MKITKKSLFKFLLQNLDRTFPYFNGSPSDTQGCVLCEYFKSKGLTDFLVGGTYYRIGKKNFDIPQWFANGILRQSPTGKEILTSFLT